MLKERRLDKKLSSKRERTPLHIASQYNAVDAIRVLITEGKAGVHKVDKDGSASLHAQRRKVIPLTLPSCY